MGLTQKRYEQMMETFKNEKHIDDAIEEWGVDSVNKGYEIFDFNGTGMLEVNKINSVMAFCSSYYAVKQAIKDGIKIIPVEELPENFDRKYLGWIDTPENRNMIKKYCNKTNKCKTDNNLLREKLLKHIGHHVVIASYGDTDNPVDVCLECEDCGEVILDSEIYDIFTIEDD